MGTKYMVCDKTKENYSAYRFRSGKILFLLESNNFTIIQHPCDRCVDSLTCTLECMASYEVVKNDVK